MKNPILATLFAAGLLATSSTYAAPLEVTGPVTTTPSANAAGFILGADAGVFWLKDMSATSGPFRAEFKFDTGWGIDVPIGYDFGNGFSAFASIGYYDTSYKSKGSNNGPGVNSGGNVIPSGLIGYYNGESQSAQSGGDLNFLPIMFNLSYSVNFAPNFHWYFGGGAGVVRESADFTHFDFPASDSIVFGALNAGVHQFGGMNGTDWEFAFQFFTGLSYDFTPNASVNVGYHYLNMAGGITVDGNSTGHYQGSSVEAGVTFKF